MKKTRFFSMFVAVMMALLLTSSAMAETIVIGGAGPLTGGAAQYGIAVEQGAQLYVEQLNEELKSTGSDIQFELIFEDNGGDNNEAQNVYYRLTESKGAVAFLGDVLSGNCKVVAECANEDGIPMVTPSSTSYEITTDHPTVFRTCFLDPFQGTVMASYAKDLGYSTAAIICQNGDDYSTGLGAFFKQAFTSAELGGTIVAEETYQTNESDFNAILTSVKNSGAECVFIPSSIATATLILPQAAAIGLDAQIIASDTWENESIVAAAGAAAEGVAFSTFFDENDDTNPVAKEFVEGFKAFLNTSSANITANGGTDGVAAVSALGYDAYMCMYNALAALDGTEGDLTSVNVRDALVNVDYDGVTGNITFDENGDANKSIAYIKEVKDGKFVFVKTQEAK